MQLCIPLSPSKYFLVHESPYPTLQGSPKIHQSLISPIFQISNSRVYMHDDPSSVSLRNWKLKEATHSPSFFARTIIHLFPVLFPYSDNTGADQQAQWLSRYPIQKQDAKLPLSQFPKRRPGKYCPQRKTDELASSAKCGR